MAGEIAGRTHDRVFSIDGYEVHVDPAGSERHLRTVRKMEEGGVAVPLPHRPSWSRAFYDDSWFVSVKQAGASVYGFAARVLPSRAIPGHRVLRVDKFGAVLDPRHAEIALWGMRQLVSSERRVMRLYVDVFSRRAPLRHDIGEAAKKLGYRASTDPGCYLQTAALDLSPDVDAILASVHPTARRHIRAPAKKGYEVRPILDERFATRLTELLDESMRRTGGPTGSVDWERQIAFGRENTGRSLLVGTFEPGGEGPASLLGFALGEFHGDYASYSHAACTRATGSSIPLTYAPTWELIRWAKENGATWFDFGGITDAEEVDAEVLRGISDFKRYFTADVVRVGEEWIFEPHAKRAFLAKTVSAVASKIRDVVPSGS